MTSSTFLKIFHIKKICIEIFKIWSSTSWILFVIKKGCCILKFNILQKYFTKIHQTDVLEKFNEILVSN